jgi:hypothetical protein
MVTKEYLKERFNSFTNFVKSFGDEYFEKIHQEMYMYSLYLAGADSKISKKELDLIKEVTRCQVKDPEAIYNKLKKVTNNWDNLLDEIPDTLELFFKIDEKNKSNFEESLSYSYVGFYFEYGKFLIELEDKKSAEDKAFNQYIAFLIKECKSKFNINTANSDDKSKDDSKKVLKKETSQSKKTTQEDHHQKEKIKEESTVKFKAVPCSESSPTNPVTYLEFWQTLKPYLDKLNHKEFSKVKLKENDCLDTNPSIIVGVYYSILVRKSKKLIRLEAYIATETEIGNLQIIDYIKSHIKEPNLLKGKIEYDRKEGRIAQKVSVSLNGFEFEDRNCWDNYAKQLVSIIDPFMDAVNTCLKSLI